MGMLRRLRNLWLRERIEREIQAEHEAHIDLRTEDNIAAGNDRTRRSISSGRHLRPTVRW